MSKHEISLKIELPDDTSIEESGSDKNDSPFDSKPQISESSASCPNGKIREALRKIKKDVQLANQNIIELAYLWKDTIGDSLIGGENEVSPKLMFEQANCYHHTYYLIRNLLEEKVDGEYLDMHEELKQYFFQDRELKKRNDRLSWTDSG